MHFSFFVRSAHKASLKDERFFENHPLGGSETAALGLARALRRSGHRVDLLTEAEELAACRCDVFVSNRAWHPFHAGFYPGKLNYLWAHDDAQQPLLDGLREAEVARSIYSRLDAVLLVSNYQMNRWVEELHLPPDKACRFQNGVPTEAFSVTEESVLKRPRRAFYASVPDRGLEQLLQMWPLVQNAVPDAELWLFSSYALYNSQDNEDMQALLAHADTLKNVQRFQPVPHPELYRKIQQCRVLAYPTTFRETSCLVAMEAMAAGCAVVSTATGALPETAWRNPLVALSEGYLDAWAMELVRVLVDDQHYRELAVQNLDLTRWNSWDVVARRFLRRVEEDARRTGA